MTVLDSLGRRLQLVQGIVWAHSANGDPYAALLRGFDEDVAPIHQRARARGRLWRSAMGSWVTADHRVGSEVLTHPALGVRRVDGNPVDQPEQVIPFALDTDVVEAERLRSVWELAGQDESAQRGRGIVQQACARVLDGVAAQFADQFDMVDVVERAPVEALADLFTLCECQRVRLREDCAAAAIAMDSVLCPQPLDATDRMLVAIEDLRALFGELAGPQAGLSAWVRSDGPGPTPKDVRAWGTLAAVVAVPMAASLVTNALLALADKPALWSALAGDQGLAGLIVAETLRYDPPVQVAVSVASADLDLAGQRVLVGQQVAVLLGAANRDPAFFPQPDRFDPHRVNAPTGLALSPGAPYHVVLPFARVLAESLLRELAVWWPRLRACGPPVRRHRAPVTRGLLHLPTAPN